MFFYSFFWCNHRIAKINGWNRTYNESNLLTFEDKMNWIAIHDVNKLKGRCSDKILLHEYSKRILKKDIIKFSEYKIITR